MERLNCPQFNVSRPLSAARPSARPARHPTLVRVEWRSEARESARLEMPEPLRRDVRLLGELLGQVVAEGGGPDLLADVERLRRAVIAARDSNEEDVEAERLVGSWPPERAEDVARAFTCYFHLANLAEEHHRARILRERDRTPAAVRESLQATVAEIRAEQGDDRLRALLDGLVLHPVLTAHPTEARRRAVVTAIRRIGEQLERLDDPRCSDPEERDARRRLLEAIDVLWRTAQLRSTQLEPMDEVRATLAVFDETLFAVVPAMYRRLDTALSPDDAGVRPPLAPAFVRFGTWVGGDRDGNPHVTPASADLRRRLAAAEAVAPGRLAGIAQRSPGEPHRQFVLHVAERIVATRT